MSKSKNGEKLTISEKFELAVQGGFQLIPFGIGASLSTIYYGAKQEKRFKRIEAFYKEISQDIEVLKEREQEDIKDKLSSLNEDDQAALVVILDELNDKIEHEHIRKKIDYLKQYFMNTLKIPVKENIFEERRFFLDTLSQMTLLECDVLNYLFYKNEIIHVKEIEKEGVDQYAIVGSINRLKSYGFLSSSQLGITFDDLGADIDVNLKESVKITDYGMRFYIFCLKDN